MMSPRRPEFAPTPQNRSLRRATNKEPEIEMKLYVGNLPYTIDDNSLRGLFEGFGEVHSARVVTDRDSGQSKGFGFVEMNDGEAQSAMSALNGQEHGGRTLRVNEARPQEARTGGGGGGRGGYGGGYGGGRGRY